MTDYPVTRGYRILGDRKPERQLSTSYLQHSSEGSRLLAELWHRAPIEGANCVGREDEFSGDELPTDREAELMCASCPLANLCRDYAKVAHPAWGIFGGIVHGRVLQEAMKDAED